MLSQFKPEVQKTWLMTIAGLMWSVVGLMLCRFAIRWLFDLSRPSVIGYALTGAGLAIIANYLVFSKIAGRNIDRLNQMPEKVCIFAFQAWKSYLVIGLMITIGSLLRHSPAPKHYLSIIYIAIGGALFLSSLQYYRGLRLWRKK
ncbi:MAG: hypothetical protein K9L30_15460 [Desulfobacterales bacterium]|nr:hypothetical protein [Desulfobacterales bacterium]